MSMGVGPSGMQAPDDANEPFFSEAEAAAVRSEMRYPVAAVEAVEEYLAAGRRGRYHDENDDIGIAYDSDDMRLAEEEGTYLVRHRRREVVDGVDVSGRGGGTLSLEAYRRRAAREVVTVPTLEMEHVEEFVRRVNATAAASTTAAAARNPNTNGSSSGNVLVAAASGVNAVPPPPGQRVAPPTHSSSGGAAARPSPSAGGRTPTTTNIPQAAAVPSAGRVLGAAPSRSPAAAASDHRSAGVGANGRVPNRLVPPSQQPPAPTPAAGRRLGTRTDAVNANPSHNTTAVPIATDGGGGVDAAVADVDVGLCAAAEARTRRKLYRTCDVAWFTHSGEPADVLAFRSMIANDVLRDPPPPMAGRLAPEVLSMVFLFIPAANRRHVASLSAVCRYWRYYANYGPQWTRFRHNAFLGQFPAPVAEKLRQRKIVTRDELIEERRRAKASVAVAVVASQAKAVGKEALILVLLLVLLLAAWGLAALVPRATTSLNTDGRIGATVFLSTAALTGLEYVLLHKLIDRKVFADPDAIAVAGDVAQGKALPSRVIAAAPPLLFAFNVAAAVVIALLFGRIEAVGGLLRAGSWDRSTPQQWWPDPALVPSMPGGGAAGSGGSGTGPPAPPSFVVLPAPLADPRWMLVNTSMFYTTSVVGAGAGGTESGLGRNRTDFLRAACPDGGTTMDGCYALLWFDAQRQSPLFQQANSSATVPAATLIPDYWNSTYGPCAANATPAVCCVNVSASCMGWSSDGRLPPSQRRVGFGIETPAEAAALLLRTVSLAALGLDLWSSRNTTAAGDGSSSSSSSSCLPLPASGSFLRASSSGTFVALSSTDALSLLAIAVGPDPYAYVRGVRDEQNRVGNTTAVTSYAAATDANFYAFSPAAAVRGWYRRRWWGVGTALASGAVPNATLVTAATGETVAAVQPPYWAALCSSTNDTNTTTAVVSVPLLCSGALADSYAATEQRRTRLLGAQFALVGAFLAAVALVGLAAMAVPYPYVLLLGQVSFVLAALLVNPLTLIAAGAVCVVQATHQPPLRWSSLHPQPARSGIEAPFMCGEAAGVGMIATGAVIIVIATFITVKRRCYDMNQ